MPHVLIVRTGSTGNTGGGVGGGFLFASVIQGTIGDVFDDPAMDWLAIMLAVVACAAAVAVDDGGGG